MNSRFMLPKRKPIRLPSARLPMLSLALLLATGVRVFASDRPIESIAARAAGDPILAIVSLQDQQITVYDANGWILRAPVSSGQKTRETPAGIFSVIQKDADHHSNLYDDASMPHMQRLTWSGIALHGGPLPGYPASHGCVRMPFNFAERLFDLTELGLRVIVAPTNVSPVEIVHPALVLSKSGAGGLADTLRAVADEADRKADQARLVAGKAFREAAQATAPVRAAENLKLRADAQLEAIETVLGSAVSAEAKEQVERDKAQVVARITDLQAQLAAAKVELQPKLDAVAIAREASAVAETSRAAAAEALRQMARESAPVSILVSRKTQRIYVRQAFEPILEAPITILDTDRPIGTHIFTALARTDGDANMRWNVVSLGGRPADGVVEPQGRTRKGQGRDVESLLTDPGTARSALDRIVIPPDVLEHIAGVVPRSSLIITDEALSSETGKGTDFVVVLSGEPQGGIKIRQRAPGPEAEFRYDLPRDRLRYWRSPYAGPF
jgi:hypothetical protein